MNQKRVVTIQDISCFGKCSLTVALPTISAMGVETAVIPTAVLSTHTGGFYDYTFRDLTEDIEKIGNHWKSIDLKFDCIYIGYLGSLKQIEYMSEFIDKFKGENTIVLIDPVMGDNGNLYAGFTEEFPSAMSKFIKKADVIVPNLTEASLMLGEPYKKDGYDEEYIYNILKKLCGLGAKNAVLTSISYKEGEMGSVSYSAKDDKFHSYFTPKVDGINHGSGDLFASVCAGALARGICLDKAMEIATDFVYRSIKATEADKKDHWYGVRFEDSLGYLIEKTEKELQKS